MYDRRGVLKGSSALGLGLLFGVSPAQASNIESSKEIVTSAGETYSPTWAGLHEANDDLDSGQGGTIFAPPGAYNPESTLVLAEDVFITGPPTAQRKSIWKQSAPLFRPSGDVQPFTIDERATVRGGLANMVLDGANTTTADAIVTSGIALLDRIRVDGFAGAGWFQRGGVNTISYSVELCRCGYGYRADSVINHDGGNHTRHHGMRIQSCGTGVFGDSSASGYIFYGLSNQSALDWGIDLAQTDGWEFHGTWMEAHPRGQYIRFQHGANNNLIQCVNHTPDRSDIVNNGSNNVVTTPRRHILGGPLEWGMNMYTWSGRSGDFIGEVRMDNGENTTHGDPDFIIWNGSEWRQAGTEHTFT